MPRYIIPRKNLPPINPYTNSYQVRYRLISENQNRLSSWSPIFDVSPEIEYTSSAANVNHSGGVVTAVWSAYSGVDQYSVWIAWDNGLTDSTWIYNGDTSLTSLIIEKPSGANKFSIGGARVERSRKSLL